LTKAYIYANGEILAQHNGDDCMANRSFYLHDRLGSVRQVISYETNGLVLNSYTYGPFGEMIAADCAETTDNPFKFTGQDYDYEIGQYYLRARQYDPQLMRFTDRDPISGRYEEPLTLHKYLYCLNDSTNRVDPSGLYCGWDDLAAALAGATWGVIGQAISDTVSGRAFNWDNYTSAAIGGAVGGWASLYSGAAGGGAIGGGVTAFMKEAFKSFEENGNINGVLSWQTAGNVAWGTATGYGAGVLMPSGATGWGRGSFAAVAQQMITKMENGIVNNITCKTFGKIFAYEMTEVFYANMATSIIDGF
jgi:RHS repeat-associated protein